MEKLFENTTVYTKELYNNFLIFHNKKYNLKYNIYTGFVSLLLLFCMVSQYLYGLIDIAMIFLLIFIAFIFWRVFHPYFIVNKEVKSDKIQKELKNIYSFFDKYMEIQNSSGISKISYYKLHRFFQDDKCFYLYIDSENAFVIDKQGFSLGTYNDFYTFIKKKMWYKLF